MAQSTNRTKKACVRHTCTYIPIITQLYLYCTFTLEALFNQTPQQTSTVVTEGGTHVVVVLETMWHINLKAFLLELWGQMGFVISMNVRWQWKPKQRSAILHCPAYLSHLFPFSV